MTTTSLTNAQVTALAQTLTDRPLGRANTFQAAEDRLDGLLAALIKDDDQRAAAMESILESEDFDTASMRLRAHIKAAAAFDAGEDDELMEMDDDYPKACLVGEILSDLIDDQIDEVYAEEMGLPSLTVEGILPELQRQEDALIEAHPHMKVRQMLDDVQAFRTEIEAANPDMTNDEIEAAIEAQWIRAAGVIPFPTHPFTDPASDAGDEVRTEQVEHNSLIDDRIIERDQAEATSDVQAKVEPPAAAPKVRRALRAPKATKAPKPPNEAKSATEHHTPRDGTKQAALIAMLRAPGGASMDEIITTTGWQAHTVRGAMAGALKKKLGLNVSSNKIGGARAGLFPARRLGPLRGVCTIQA